MESKKTQAQDKYDPRCWFDEHKHEVAEESVVSSTLYN